MDFTTDTHEWTHFYTEIANKILEYQNNRRELLMKVKMILLTTDNEDYFDDTDEICPFSVMGVFNRGIDEANRINILELFAKTFDIITPIPTLFSDFPLLLSMDPRFYEDKATGYNRTKHIDKLWDLFEAAIFLADSPSREIKGRFIEFYNYVISQPCRRHNITFGLFWIRANYYIPLYETTKKRLVDNGFAEKGFELLDIPNARKYLEICDRVKNRQKIIADAIPTSQPVAEVEPNIETAQEQETLISTQQWLEMFDNSIITPSDILLLRKWLYFGGKATCSEIGRAYYAHPSSFISPVVSMGKRVSSWISEISPQKAIGEMGWWVIPFTGKYTNDNTHFEWTIRPELRKALQLREIMPLKPPKILYTKSDFLSDVYISEEQYDDITAILDGKKNIILQGAPGVGKSYMAKRLAYSIIGAKDDSRIEMVQFHQNYSYEDFIEGFRPNDEGKFTIRKGVFYNFCKKAQGDSDNKYFFIIDEINRGVLSKIMGELMLLLESDKRGDKNEMRLTYSQEPFAVPENVYVIGMMNTADRSIAMIDYALRRRFSFVTIEPAYGDPGFAASFKNNYAEAETVTEKMTKLNKYISESLGEGYQIGHSHFCHKRPLEKQDIDRIVKYEIAELLKEYYFDDEEGFKEAKGMLP
jgi:5-methylcytosine-specific restriction protein B